MKFVTQTKFGKEGNCLPACIATILQLDINDIPNFCQYDDWFDRMNDWLKKLGYQALICKFVSYDDIPKVDCILSGMTDRGLMHSVVGHGSYIIHDPHPDRIGIHKIEDCIFFIPISFAERKCM